VEILEVGPEDPRLPTLISALRDELDARYPEEISFNHPTVKEQARYLLATLAGEPVACCAVQPLDGGECELKRMYVAPEARGRRIATRLMVDAEAIARRLGAQLMKLETGPRQPEAIAVYERAGFSRIPNYSPYDQWDLSYCYAKSL
jgi:GNAT superfamily N-acetyltransferase